VAHLFWSILVWLSSSSSWCLAPHFELSQSWKACSRYYICYIYLKLSPHYNVIGKEHFYWSLCLNKANAYHFDHGSDFGWFCRLVPVKKFKKFQLLHFSFDRCTIIINFCYLLLIQKCARLFVFLFRRDQYSWTIPFSFFQPMNPRWHQSFWLCGAQLDFAFHC